MSQATLKHLIERRNNVKQTYDELSKETKDTKKILEDLEHEILGELNETGLDMVRVDNVTVSRNDQDFYTVTDWDEMYEYIKQNDAHYLLQKRLMQAGISELVDNGNTLPVDKFVKHKVSIRKV